MIIKKCSNPRVHLKNQSDSYLKFFKASLLKNDENVYEIFLNS